MADWLVAQGLDQVFAVTGGGAMFLNQSLGGHPKLKCVFMHHEQACAMAAEAYARITGRPAILMVTTGPGAINALNGVFGAYTDSIPMLVLSGQVKRETCVSFHPNAPLRQLGDQEGPIIQMAQPVCKYAQLIRSESELEYALPHAYAEAIGGRPGPTWLDIPLDIQQSTAPLKFRLKPPAELPQDNALRTACQAIVQKLCQANRPLILGGTGVRLSETHHRLIACIERHQLPLATAWTHDLIASDHPLFAGRPGTIGTRPGNFCLQAADFVLVLGSRLNIRQTGYNFNTFAKSAWVAQVDIDPCELNKPTYQPDFGVVADLKIFFDVFEQELAKAKLPSYQPWIEWCRKKQVEYKPSHEHIKQEGAEINPYLVVDQIFKSLRDDDIIACGNASACILPFQIGTLRKNQRLFSNSGSASMGYDLPAAIGAAVASSAVKNRRVICFAGDGSLQMNIQELQTIKSLKLNIIVIVLNNSGYLSIRQTHENFFQRVIGATPETGIEFPEYAGVAKAYGLNAYEIKTNEEIGLLYTLLQQDGPLLIDIKVDPKQEFTPRIKSRVDSDGKFLSPELDDMYPFIKPEELQAIRQESALIRSIS